MLFRSGVELTHYANDTAILTDSFTGKQHTVEHVDYLLYSTPRRVHDELLFGLTGREYRLIGDCVAPRNLYIAIHEGHALGQSIGK